MPHKAKQTRYVQHFWSIRRTPVDPTRPPLNNLHFNLIRGENFKNNNSTFGEQKKYALHDHRTKFTVRHRLT